MPRGELPSFDHYRGEVGAMLAVGRPLGAVERMLERTPLTPDQRSALWLLAWAEREDPGPDDRPRLALVGPERGSAS